MASKQQQQQFRAQIRDAGLRATGQRVSVLATLVAAPTPLSHAELADRLQDTGIDRATVYRNLQDLVEAGMLRRADLGDHVWRYEIASGGAAHPSDGHPHFLCRDCGTVSCLSGASVQVKAPKSAPGTVRKGDFEVQLRGLCDACV